MKRSRQFAGLLVVLAAVLLAGPGAAAEPLPVADQSIDIATFTCRDFSNALKSADPQEQLATSLIVAWLAGRATPEGPTARIDVTPVADDAAKLERSCQATPGVTLQEVSPAIAGADPSSPDAELFTELMCKDLELTTLEDVESLATTVFWFAGHYKQVAKTTRIETGLLEHYIKVIGDICRKSPATTLAGAAKQAFNTK